MIFVNELHKPFVDQLVLDGTGFRVDEGSVFALLGPNGSGKTTTVQILSTLPAADAGDVRIDGYDLAVSVSSSAPRTGVAPARGQEIVRRVEHHGQQQVEVGEHRGPLGSTARIGTADFDLPRYVSYPATKPVVESLI